MKVLRVIVTLTFLWESHVTSTLDLRHRQRRDVPGNTAQGSQTTTTTTSNPLSESSDNQPVEDNKDPTGQTFDFGNVGTGDQGSDVDVGNPIDLGLPVDVGEPVGTEGSDETWNQGSEVDSWDPFGDSFDFPSDPVPVDTGPSDNGDTAPNSGAQFNFGSNPSPESANSTEKSSGDDVSTNNGAADENTDPQKDGGGNTGGFNFNNPPANNGDSNKDDGGSVDVMLSDMPASDGSSDPSTENSPSPNESGSPTKTNSSVADTGNETNGDGAGNNDGGKNDNPNQETETDSDLSPDAPDQGQSPENKSFDFSNNNGGNGNFNEGQEVETVDLIGDLPDDFFSEGESLEQDNVTVADGDSDDFPDDAGEPQVGRSVSKPLRPFSERMCFNDPSMACLHGYSVCGADFSSSCVCDKGWTGLFCDVECWLPCQNGNCRIRDEMTANVWNLTEQDLECNCEWRWTGDLCEELKPDPEEEARILAAILASIFGVAILMMVVMLIVLWRLRVIFVMKLVYLFKGYEDDDGKQYDAYISLSPSHDAESFVCFSLQPKLEELGFKVFIQAKDGLAGAMMSDSILDAMEQSRRTIMVVTPDYVKHEWARFEFLIAQHETLRLKQRIIPIILGELEQEKIDEDKSLKHILSSIKCLRCPASLTPGSPVWDDFSPSSTRSPNPLMSTADMLKKKLQHEKKEQKFWKRLELTMPKKKITDDSGSEEESRLQRGLMDTQKQLDISDNFLVLSKENSKDSSVQNRPNNLTLSNESKIDTFDLEKNLMQIGFSDIALDVQEDIQDLNNENICHRDSNEYISQV